MTDKFTKRPPDAIVVAVEFAGALNPGETVVTSNARGTVGVTAATDSGGADVSATFLEGDPWIVAGTQVAFWLLGGAPRTLYWVSVTAPTSDGELITERVLLEVLA